VPGTAGDVADHEEVRGEPAGLDDDEFFAEPFVGRRLTEEAAPVQAAFAQQPQEAVLVQPARHLRRRQHRARRQHLVR
jgi:hypothetical protein